MDRCTVTRLFVCFNPRRRSFIRIVRGRIRDFRRISPCAAVVMIRQRFLTILLPLIGVVSFTFFLYHFGPWIPSQTSLSGINAHHGTLSNQSSRLNMLCGQKSRLSPKPSDQLSDRGGRTVGGLCLRRIPPEQRKSPFERGTAIVSMAD
jgi:hypothetical protein